MLRSLIVLVVAMRIAAADTPESGARAAAVELHKRAQTSGATADYQAAETAYASYLSAYPTAAGTDEIHFFRGQILILKLNRGVAGADEMMIVARSKPPGKFHEDALRLAIDAYATAGEDAKLREAADLFFSLFAGGPDAVGVMFKLAKRARDRKDFEEATKLLLTIVTKFPKDPLSGPAGDLLLETLSQAQDYETFESSARLLKRHPAFQSAPQQQRLDQVIEQAITVRADHLVADHRDRDAAEMYLRAATEFPKSQRADELLFNAGAMFERAKDPFRAADVLRRSAESSRGSSLPLRAMFRAAQLDQEWQPARAVDEYMRAAGMGCPPPQRGNNCGEVRDSLYNAGLLYFALGEHAKAAVALGILVKADKTNDGAAFLLADFAERAKDDARAATAFEDYAKKSGQRSREGWLHAGRAALRLGQIDRARRDFTNALNLSRGFTELGEARLAQAETFERETSRISLDVPAKQLKAAIAKRTTLIAQTAAIYTDVVNAKDPTLAIAALVRTAHLYDDFATALVTATGPPGLTKEQLRAYREQLDAISSGIKDKAIDAYALALANAQAFGVLSTATIDAHAQLVRLAPQKFPPEREARAPLRGEREYSPVIVLETRP